ncbi:HypC/HybG/HupF family hydrogenase formation chaperone [Acidiferrobacter thiooxydans]|uniref:HypC/HybG/HupF family hydrogenase formation chaperone n=1 Tax=Acidiferrobacter thiooxydans TaxID=163359 RepID=UPI00082460D6|nr:HypC/HybG/HupF family hydrogenase formation chaperone [Gammaproteobacteria bacterium]
MCLAVPMRVEQVLADDLAVVEIGGVRKTVSLALVDGVAEGDYVIVHVGFALTRLDADEARKTLDLFAEIAQVAGTGSLEGP